MENATCETQNSSLEFINRLIISGKVNFNPPYQRKIVWSEIKQSELIDSIMGTWPINPVYFAKSVGETGMSMTCIDGKQRLTSIHKFFNNEIPHIVPDQQLIYFYSKINASYTIPKGYKAEVMNESMKFEIESKAIQTISYSGVNEDQEREIFYRLQNGVSLTVAEKMNSINTESVNYAKELSAKYFEKGIGKLMNGARGNDVLIFMRAIAICCGNAAVIKTNTELKKFLKKTTLNDEEKAKVDVVMMRIKKLIDSGTFKANKNHGIILISILIIVINSYMENDDDDIMQVYTDMTNKLRNEYKMASGVWLTDTIKNI